MCVNVYVYAGGGVYVHIERPQDVLGSFFVILYDLFLELLFGVKCAGLAAQLSSSLQSPSALKLLTSVGLPVLFCESKLMPSAFNH